MIDKGPAPQPPSKDELLAALKPVLSKVIEEDVEGDSSAEKIEQYAQARRNYLMFRNKQFLAPVMGSNGVADYQSVAGTGSGDQGSFDYTLNVFRGYGRKFIAVMGQRAPNVTAMADNPEDEESVRVTRSANDANAILDSWWDVDERNIEAALNVWTTGPAYIYTPWNADGLMYGFREEPKYEAEQQAQGEPHFHCIHCGADVPQPTPQGTCPQCGAPMGEESQVAPEMVDVPVQKGTTKYPNGRVECYVTDCTTTTTPFYTLKLKLCPWLKYEYEESKGALISKYTKLRGQNLSDAGAEGNSDQGKMTRDAILSPTGTPLRNHSSRWLYTRIWIQPKMYEGISDANARQMLQDNFPTGLKITKVQNQIVDLEEEGLTEVWAVIKPEASITINADPIGADMVSTQLLKNHTLNIAAETLERGIPQTLADPRVWNFQAQSQRRASPAEMVPALPAVGDSMGDSFFQLPAAHFSDQMLPWMSSVESDATTVVGTVPTIFGGGNAGTAREAEINKNAAMMQLGTTWLYFRKGWEAAKRNGVLQLVKYGSGVVKGGSTMLDLNELTTAGWHFTADEAIPTTWGQQRDLEMFMMEKAAPILEAFGYNRPENIAKSSSLLGMPPGWYTPGLADVEKTRATIQKLLKAQPIQKQNPDGSMDIQPSIPVDSFEDNHQLVVQVIQAWAQKQAQPGGIREANPNGYANVIAYGTASQKLANPPAPVPPPPQPKMNVTANLKDLAPETGAALFKDFNLSTPVPPSPQQPALPGSQQPNMPGNGAPPGPPPATAGLPIQ